MKILGISALYHDSAAAIIVDGEIIAAAQEERFTRKKHDAAYPEKAISYALQEANLELGDVDYVVFYDKPFLKFERLLETYIASVPRGFRSFKMAMPIWLREKLFLKDYLLKQLKGLDKRFNMDQLLFSEHHLSHAASAFFPSPFEKAVVLTLDGVGEWATTSVAIGDGNKLDIVRELHFPHSLGLLYSAFTYYTGFRVNSGEYKLMGLAPYGEPRYRDTILEHLVDVKDDGSFRLDQKYFNYSAGLTMTSKKFAQLFGEPVRQPDTDQITQFHMDIAASIQAVTEDIVLKLCKSLAAEFQIPNLCLAGGVALNCVANGKVLQDASFDNIWIQPAAGDAGGAIGAALAAEYLEFGHERQVIKPDSMKGAYLGPEFNNEQILQELTEMGAVFTQLQGDELYSKAAFALSEDKALGWFQGRMEFGPRSLGGRSILGNPMSAQTQKTLNLKVKYRESFRPFAPSVLEEHSHKWFDLQATSPYMLLVAPVHSDIRREMVGSEKELFGIDKLNVERSSIPAVTHVDYSARVQTVSKATNPHYHALITEFYKITACPVVVNTSFNVRGEPIVCSVSDAFRCFMGTELDSLYIGSFELIKEEQSVALIEDYKDKYDLD